MKGCIVFFKYFRKSLFRFLESPADQFDWFWSFTNFKKGSGTRFPYTFVRNFLFFYWSKFHTPRSLKFYWSKFHHQVSTTFEDFHKYVFGESCLGTLWRHGIWKPSSVHFSSNGWHGRNEGKKEIIKKNRFLISIEWVELL